MTINDIITLPRNLHITPRGIQDMENIPLRKYRILSIRIDEGVHIGNLKKFTPRIKI